MATKAEKVNGTPPDAAAAEVMQKQVRPSNLFPQHRLEDVLSIVETIEGTNAGQPVPPSDIAIALGKSPGSSGFHQLLSSSLRYGLTTGSYKSPRIALTPLGSRIAAPTSPDERRQSVVEAALTPETFRAVYEHFRGKKLPQTQYLANTLSRDFGIPAGWAEQGADVFRENLQFAGLLKQATTGLWVGEEPETAAASATVAPLDEFGGQDEGSSGAPASEVLGSEPPAPPATSPEPEKPQPPKAIFVGHGPDKTALDQLTKILEELGLPYKVAEYEPNAGRPISQKVADLMDECGAAILLFTGDRELRDLEGNAVWISSANVAHELGATSVLYNGKVVVFKESGVDLASNYSGIGYIEFEKGRLSAHAMDLFREIRHFGLITISVGE